MIRYLRVEDARIYYQTTGSGPALLISQSGEGDADRTVDLAGHLADRFTVVTYDRRGLSRSGPAGPVSIRRHAEDAAAILKEVTDTPAYVLGLSLGAVIGLHILCVYPGLIARLIAHEPIALPFLAQADADVARAKLLGVRRVHQQDGWRAAAAEVATVLGIDPARQETEPGITRFPLTDQRAAFPGQRPRRRAQRHAAARRHSARRSRHPRGRHDQPQRRVRLPGWAGFGGPSRRVGAAVPGRAQRESHPSAGVRSAGTRSAD
jgi:pimeloyl-ACP methyl ester carboxylesterase